MQESTNISTLNQGLYFFIIIIIIILRGNIQLELIQKRKLHLIRDFGILMYFSCSEDKG